MRITLANVKASTIPGALGIAACDPRFTRYLNEAQARLATDGKWWGTYKRLRVCVSDGCVTWPEEVLVVEAITLGGVGLPIRNSWYEFMEDVRAPQTCAEDQCAERQLLDRGTVYQFRNFTGLSKVRLYPASATDAGKRVLIQGLDANGNEIRTNDGIAGWVSGEYLTLASPFVESTNAFKSPGLTGVQKPVTNNRIVMTGVNTVTAVETQVAYWSPGVTVPEYRRTFLTGRVSCASTDVAQGCDEAVTDCATPIVNSIVRLKCIDAVADSDWMFISNLRALKEAMRCIQKEDANQPQEAEVHYQNALRALRNELEQYSPKERMAINVQAFGTAKPRRIFGGFI